MSIEITKPTAGRVTLDMSYEDARVVAAIIGSVNFGDFKKHAPELSAELEASGFWKEFPLLGSDVSPVQRGTQIYLEEATSW